MMPEHEQRLRDEYAAATTEYERAAIEMRVRDEFQRGCAQANAPRDRYAIARLLDVPISAVEERCSIFLAGEAAAPLWLRLEQDMAFATAVNLLRKARASSKRGEPLQVAVERVLAEYDALPVVRVLSGGKIRRFLADSGRWGAVRKKPVTPPMETPRAQKDSPDHDFWDQIRGLARGYVQRRTVGHSPEQIDAEVRLLEMDLKIAFDTFANRVQYMTRQTPLSVVVQRRRLNDACRVLHVDPPHKITAVPKRFFTHAQKQFRSLARAYHPDTNGTDVTRPQFEAVMEAWNVIRQFKDSMGTGAHG